MKITFSNVSASYGKGPGAKRVLDGLSFTVSSPTRLVILGENGSGKTTLLRILSGILPYEGSVTVDGRELSLLTREEAATRFAFLEQLSGAYFSYTVRETVSHGRYLRQKARPLFHPSEEDEEAVTRILEETGLTALSMRRIDTLSGGQLQRVFLARAFAQDTPVLLLDEPANHLDIRYQAELASYLRAWSGGKTLLPDGSSSKRILIGVFHDLMLGALCAEEVLMLKEGRLAAFGKAEELLRDRALLTDVFGLDVLSYLHSFPL